MSLGRPLRDRQPEPETIPCPRCGAQAGVECIYPAGQAPARAVHPARYAALTGIPVEIIQPREFVCSR